MNMQRSRMMIHIALVAFAVGLPSGCSRGETPLTEFSGATMGTQYHVRLANLPSGSSPKTLQTQIEATLDEVNAQMSTWREDSELSRFNRSASTDWFSVSPETAAVVAEAQRVSELSDGSFDVTVGPLVNQWQFGPERDEVSVPTDEEIAAARARIGYKKLEVRMEPPALRKLQPDLYVDLSAIAKGHGVDRVAEDLIAIGVRGFLVEIGGEIRTHGTKPGGGPWRVGIEKPVANQRSVQIVIPMRQQSLATSGDYRNFFAIDGVTYSHTINPHTGWPVSSELASASVVDESCMSADAYATTLMVLGPKAGYNWAVEQGIAALLILRDGQTFVEKRTPAFEELFGHAGKQVTAENTDQVMNTFLAAAVLIGLALVGMAIGVIVSNRRLRGSCGGLSAMRDSQGRSMCEMCTTPRDDCSGVPQPNETKPEECDAAR